MSRLIFAVTPFVGVWIETTEATKISTSLPSHPSWVCGLKLKISVNLWVNAQSHPSWVCGLKLISIMVITNLMSHTLRGCVD